MTLSSFENPNFNNYLNLIDSELYGKKSRSINVFFSKCGLQYEDLKAVFKNQRILLFKAKQNLVDDVNGYLIHKCRGSLNTLYKQIYISAQFLQFLSLLFYI